MREDKNTLDKERFDYALVLLATSSLEVVNVFDKFLVEDVMVEVNIIKEWGFSLGEDVCLFEEDYASKVSHSGHGWHAWVLEDSNNIDEVVEKLADEWVEEEMFSRQHDIHQNQEKIANSLVHTIAHTSDFVISKTEGRDLHE